MLAVAAGIGTMFAEKVKIGDLYYNLDATSQTAEVTSQNSSSPYWSTSITTVNIPASVEYNAETYSVTSIGSNAFYECNSLTSVTIGKNVTNIAEPGFATCQNLTSVIWNAKHCQDFSNLYTPFYYIEGNPAVLAYTYDVATNITSFVFGDDVEYIPAYLCQYMNNVSEIVVPNCLTQIGTMAFLNCNYRVEGTYNTTLQDTTLCYDDDLYIGGVKCDLQKSYNNKQKWDCVLKTTEGCDSTISISVFWKKLEEPNSLSSTDCYDYPNTGSISYYYSIEPGRGYDYYTLNGVKNASLTNLTAGNYRLAFHNEVCEDSIVKTLQIRNGSMRVNNMYYLLDDENHTAVLSYRGESSYAYSNEYSGNITIPETITFQNKEYQVTGINSNTFSGCSNIQSITIESETPIIMPYNSGLSNSCTIYVPFGLLNAYKSSGNWSSYTVHVIDPSHAVATCGATSANIIFGNSDEQNHIVSCGIEGGESTNGYILDYNGLEPNSEYQNVPFFINTREGDHDIISVSFTTTTLSLTTQPSQPVSSNTAILLAQTNMADIETSCGFEWKRTDAPDDMAGNKVYAPVANGTMAGRLKNLNENVYYKYRAFYQSATGNMYYGDWQYIFTGDAAVEFDPILYTYAATAVTETSATLKGYALAGSDDFTEQGFEYWSESRVNPANAPYRMPAALGEHHTVTATGISMRVSLTGLDAGTVYRYRSYAKIGDQTIYGSEMTFTTQGTYVPPTYIITFVNWDGSELLTLPEVEEETLPVYTGDTPVRPDDEQYTYTFNGWSPAIVIATADATYTATYTETPKGQGIDGEQSNHVQCTKVIRNGQIYILRGDKTYTLQGQEVK